MRICAFCETKVKRKEHTCPICGKSYIIYMSKRKMANRQDYRDEMDIKSLRGCVGDPHDMSRDYGLVLIGFSVALFLVVMFGRLL